ncbi:PIN domain-containing protein [Sphingomonas sp. dw_22]|uniref:PIN domain-containing protein n=1 Tax=Sphingomonas sp. dw_22 TaxID=2721175 RepID=UPI001BD46AEE|nr:PIN domain-containing protein [Sphingomonas sp. dw_22]
MATAGLHYRECASLPLVGAASPRGPLLLDTNVILNALTGRGPPVLKALLANLPQSFVSAPPVAELSWTRGVSILIIRKLPAWSPPSSRPWRGSIRAKILTPTADHWSIAGQWAGAAVRAVAGETRSFKNAADRYEMLNDALIAVVASEAGISIVTQDADFDLFMQIDPALDVLFYG